MTWDSSGHGRVLDPIVLVLCLGLVAAFAGALHLAGVPRGVNQQLTASLAVLFFLGTVLLSHENGLSLLFLVPPLFNGEDLRPYFFLLEILVYLTIFRGLFAHQWWRLPSGFPYAPVVLLFGASALLSFPLNLKEMWLEYQLYPWRDVLEDVRRSELTANLFYVRTVLNVLTGIAVYALAARVDWRPTAGRLAAAATVLYAVVGAAGLWMYWHPVPLSHFLTIGFGWGELTGGVAGLGWNVSYFGQYALAYLPLAGLALASRGPRWARGAAVAALLLAPYAVLSTQQRAAQLVLGVELVLLVLVGLALYRARRSRAGAAVFGVMAGVVALLMALLVLTPLSADVVGRFQALWRVGDAYRMKVLRVAWQMFLSEPLLGIGSGRFAQVYHRDYDPDPAMLAGSLSTHNLYAQVLAEQGGLGLLSFGAIVAVVLVRAVRVQRWLGDSRAAVLFLLVSLGAWLVYGLFQYTFLMRSMQLYFWIVLGLLASLTSDPTLRDVGRVSDPATGGASRGSSRRLASRRVLLVLLTVLGVAAGARVHAALARPLRPGLILGVYGPEPGGARWTRSRALGLVRVQGSVLRLPMAFPVPPALGVRQTVDVLVNGVPVRRVTLESPGWMVVDLPFTGLAGATVRVELRAHHTVVPSALGWSGDTRRLGVLLGPASWAQPE